MGEVKRKNFDIPTLLKLGDLDVRRVAAENQSLTVGKYFDSLSNFMELAPTVINDLTAMVGLVFEKNSFKDLAEIRTLLEGLGYTKLLPVIDGMISSGVKGNTEFVASCAKRILGDFVRLFNRTETAIRAGLADNQDEVADSTDLIYSYMAYSRNYGVSARGLPLFKVLEEVDLTEASRKMRILAVDDSPLMLKNISSALRDEYKVFTLSNSTQVEKFLKQVTPELFLLDYKMPDISGFELVPIIRSFEEHKETPIIFLTSMGTKDNISTAAMLGACDFVVKPFDSSTLLEKIAKHIVRKKSF
jgi:CheY-like chemotaxis protein